jgi:1-acyl-sn-glycerol-3-phosphate acyltransferase
MSPRFLAAIALIAGTIFAICLLPTGNSASTYSAALTGLFGILAGLAYWSPYRGLGFALFTYTVSTFLAVFAASGGEYREPIAMATFLIGVAYARLGLALSALNPNSHPVGPLAIGWGILASILVQFVTFVPADENVSLVPFILALTFLSLLSLLFLIRPAFELACEPILWIMYRIRSAGRGIAAMPPRGPCLVVANHACWFDPFFLAKVLPRPITAMMTSRFYDKPVLRWLFKYILRAIRVPEGQLRRGEVPEEIREAIAALDRGECVAIFPEGYLRRSEDKPLKRFGRGVWQILSARPGTPVFTCWIEGNWGSFCSYFNGKPTKNKRPDFRRPIGVAVAAPIVLDAATLARHLSTRIFLMNRVIEARQLLGLAELPPFELPHGEKEDPAAE